MRKLLIFVLALICLIQIVNATTYISGDVLVNTTQSNSSVTFSLPVEIERLSLTSINHYYEDVLYFESMVYRHCEFINYSIENFVLDSSDFNCAFWSQESAGRTIDQTLEEQSLEEIEGQDRILGFKKVFIILGISILFCLIIIFLTDYLRRKKKISVLKQIVLIFLTLVPIIASVIVFFVLNLDNMASIFVVLAILVLIIMIMIAIIVYEILSEKNKKI